MGELGDKVAGAVFAVYDALPAKCKPVSSHRGSLPWVPLSGIVVSRGDPSTVHNRKQYSADAFKVKTIKA